MFSIPGSHPLPQAFRRLAWSNVAAQAAQQIGMAAAPMAAVLLLGADVAGVGLLQLTQTLPFLLFSIPAGVLADRMSRRRIMRAGELLRGLSLACILAIAMAGWMNLPLLAVASFAGTLGAMAYSVAIPSLVPALVHKADLSAANSRIELARSMAFISGPALAGALVGWTGASAAFGVAALLSFLAVWLTSALPEPELPARQGKSFLAELCEGAAFVWGHETLRPVLTISVAFNVGFFILQTAYIPYAIHTLGVDAKGIGFTLAAYGIGMVIAAMSASWIARRLSAGTMLILGPVSGFAGCAMLVATLWMPSVWLAAGCYFLLGMGPVMWTVSSTTLRQTVTPPHLLGRVSAINTMSIYGARPLGAGAAALIGELSGVESCLWAAMGIFLSQLMLLFLSPLPRVHR